MEKQVKIGREFSFGGLIKYILPTMLTAMCLSIFKTIDDGLFVSQFVGKNALSSINIIFPLGAVVGGIGMMFAAGGSAVCAKKMGEGRVDEARHDFTALLLIALVLSTIVAVILNIFMDPILRLLGATELLMEDCRTYARITWLALPIQTLCPIVDFFYPTAGKPIMGMVSAFASGITNVVFDYILIVRMGWGVEGAALSTVLGCIATVSIGIIFYSGKKHDVHFAAPTKKWTHFLARVCRTGVAQFVDSITMGVINFIANLVMLDLVGEDGIAAYSIIGYLQYMLISAFLGITDGVSPIISYCFGSKNKERLKRTLKRIYSFVFMLSGTVVLLCYIFSSPLVSIYVNEAREPELFQMVMEGMVFAPLGFLFAGAGCLTAGVFSALSSGKFSAIMSFCRNIIFNSATIIILPQLFGLTGVWIASPISEFLSLLLAAYILFINRDNYGYGSSGIARMMEN